MTDWIGAAEDVAAQLRVDAAQRDQANQPPVAELEVLRSSGLLSADSSATDAVTRIISSADASIGHLLGYHYLHLWRASLFDNPAALARMHANPEWFFAGVSNPLDAALVRRRVHRGRSQDFRHWREHGRPARRFRHPGGHRRETDVHCGRKG
jgi:hypothetical protein